MDREELAWDSNAARHACYGGEHICSCDANIPLMLASTGWPVRKAGHSEVAKAFYENNPYPTYERIKTRDQLRVAVGESILARLLDLQIPPRTTILDVGCGTGQLANMLGISRGRIVIGSDQCLKSLKLAEDFRNRFEINNTRFLQSDLFRPPFRLASFDFVIANNVLHYTSDASAAFACVAQLVKPGGNIIVSLNNRLGQLPIWCRHWLQICRRHNANGMSLGNQRATRHSLSEVLAWFEFGAF